MADRTRVMVGGAVRHDGKYLLLKRSAEKKTHPKKWEFVGGCPYERELLEDAARREVKEETGIDVTLKEKHVFQVMTEETDWICVYYVCDADTNKVMLSKEHTEFKWMSLEEAKKLDLASGTSRAIEIIGE